MTTRSEPFGNLPGGEPVEQFTLSNAGLTLKAISLGGIVTELHVPDRGGRTADVVLGLGSLEDYLGSHPWFGAITGRVAGRITAGRFTLDGTDFELELNDPPNHLHGGSEALDKKNWCGRTGVNEAGEPSLLLSYRSPDGECGYPGNVDLRVRYTLTNDAAFRLDYEATTDRATPLSLTHHGYFNLAGEGSGDVCGHLLTIDADWYVPKDDDSTLTGEVVPVVAGETDFRSPIRMSDAIAGIHQGSGANYMVRRASGERGLVSVALFEDPASGRIMEVATTNSCLQFYTGKKLPAADLTGKSGRSYPAFAGACFECQGYPDGATHPGIDNIILRPGETYRQTTVYRFRTA